MIQKPPRKHLQKAEMNVVPYIDVMLVLLVIFMVTAPLLVQGVALDLPEVAAKSLPTDTETKILTLSVVQAGEYYWNVGPEVNITARSDEAVTLEEMTHKILQLKDKHAELRFLIRGDRATDYEAVVGAIAALQGVGVTDIGLITQATDG